MDYTRILDRLYVGSCPRTRQDIAMLHKVSIAAVLNLQTDEDHVYLNIDWPQLEEHYESFGIEVRRVQVRDFDAKDLATKLPQCIRMLRELLDAHHTVYL